MRRRPSGIFRSATQLAEEASQLEIEVLGKPIGRQDQYAAAMGGFNLIEFIKGGEGTREVALGCQDQPFAAAGAGLPPGTLDPADAILQIGQKLVIPAPT